MIRNWLSRYHVHYPKVLVYMLQASEYHVCDYLGWYHRTHDFSRVERRKRFVRTTKSLALLFMAWGSVFLFLIGAVWMAWEIVGFYKYAFFLLAVFLMPYLLAYGLTLLLFFMKLFQWPIEYAILLQARKKLEAHPAVKIGIAGSFGKTSMREILKTILSEGMKVAAPPQSYNTPLGISRFVQTLDGSEEALIFELGEYYTGDVKKLCTLVQPNLGIITGINEAHLQKFKTLKWTVGTIYELADFLGEKPTYVNGESPLAREHAWHGHIVYDRNGLGDWKIENPKTGLGGTSFIMVKNDTKLELTSGLLGLHQIGPLVAAADIARKLGLSLDQVKGGISKTRPFDHRLEPQTDSTGVVTLDDSYNGNPDGVRAVIEFLASLKGHRRWYVTPGLVEMGVQTEAVHRRIGEHLAQAGIEKIVLIKNSVTHFIETGLKEAQYQGEIIWFDDALAAFAALPHLTVPGDIVLLQNDWPDQYQ